MFRMLQKLGLSNNSARQTTWGSIKIIQKHSSNVFILKFPRFRDLMVSW